jgi:hypothetical protein
LFSLQLNAPSGGKGYRTGLRGGGPLTTLIELQDIGGAANAAMAQAVAQRAASRPMPMLLPAVR